MPTSPEDTAPRRVDASLDGASLDAAVRGLFGLSWGRARELVTRGKIMLDGRPVRTPTVRVRAGATLAIVLHATRVRDDALPAAAIVHLDAHVVVVDKPAGIATLAFDPEGMAASIGRRGKRGGPRAAEEIALDERVRALLARRARAEGRSGPPPDIGIVHRIDKETSGLLVMTRTFAAKKALGQAFRFHHVHRRYLAIVHGIPEDGTITSHLVPDRGDGLRGSIEKRRGRNRPIGDEKAQKAVTHVEVLERLGGGAGQPCALVACRLETGRTHQIRIHLSEAGHPLVGERVYVRGHPGPLVPAPRLMLHAAELGFRHPARLDTEADEAVEELRFVTPPPKDMQEMLRFLGSTRAWPEPP